MERQGGVGVAAVIGDLASEPHGRLEHLHCRGRVEFDFGDHEAVEFAAEHVEFDDVVAERDPMS